MIRRYHDFILVADEVEKDSAGVVQKFTVSVFDSPVGQGEKKERVEIPSNKFIKKLSWLAGRNMDKEAARQIKVGETLAGLLLPPYARELFKRSFDRLGKDEGLRLRLRLADELANFPWEYMYIQDARGERTYDSFLALDPRISIVRHEALSTPGDWAEPPGHRRIVVAMATPQPHTKYSELAHLPEEQKALKNALNDIAGVKTLYLPEYTDNQPNNIPSATLKDLVGALMARTDIFHFSGHGTFEGDKANVVGGRIGEGTIILADAQNNALPVSATQLAEMLRGRGVRLVVLGACDTGRRDGHNVWSGVAAALLKAGISAVVAMQYKIKDNLAAAFSGAFYRALVAGMTIDEAVAMGRVAIRAKALSDRDTPDMRDWGVPVLYLRTPGGRIFNPVSNEQAVRAAKEQLGHQIDQVAKEILSSGRMIGPVIGSIADDTATIQQKVKERVDGLLIGGYLFSIQGSRLVFRQELGTVGGTVIGPIIGRIGGRSSEAFSEDRATATLERLFRLGEPAAAEGMIGGTATQPTPADESPRFPAGGLSCTACNKPVEANWKFCMGCGNDLSARPKFCPHCGKESPARAKFCAHCGTGFNS